MDANYYIDSGTGNEVADGSYYTSAYIPVAEGNPYTLSGGGWSRIAYYNKDEDFIGGFEGNGPLTGMAPTYTRLARITIPKGYLNTAMLEKGAAATEYVPYGE